MRALGLNATSAVERSPCRTLSTSRWTRSGGGVRGAGAGVARETGRNTTRVTRAVTSPPRTRIPGTQVQRTRIVKGTRAPRTRRSTEALQLARQALKLQGQAHQLKGQGEAQKLKGQAQFEGNWLLKGEIGREEQLKLLKR